ncbi:hypothetical protein [Zemynaea arenosa]|uniref:hypothetical protein n=1 Tax=Zemynaea arenosa TaxID=2561931 RepID=UPI00142FF125|nr:hypothetical protein [Massilia arenosa]
METRERRKQDNRRDDRATAERIEMAVLTARAFDHRAARSYLLLSGVHPRVADDFVRRFPTQLRQTARQSTDRRV